jgi:hypothetical protein
MIKQTIVLLSLATAFTLSVKAQNKVLDVVTLKGGNGVIKGFINEQTPGESMSIVPSEATLKIEVSELNGAPTKKTVAKDSVTVEVDWFTLKSGETFEGEILETAPGKWMVVRTGSLAARIYRYDEIAGIGKETASPDDDIFKAYGVLDVIQTKDGTAAKGVIVEQVPGKSIKIKTLDRGVVLAFDFADIVETRREALDPARDILLQSAFMDVLVLKNGSVIKGVITQQKPGEDIRIEAAGNSLFSQKYADVVKIRKEVNPHREEVAEPVVEVREPEFLGDCWWQTGADSAVLLEKRTYVRGTRTQSLLLIEGSEKSNIRIPADTPVKFIIRVSNNDLSPLAQIHIIRTELNRGTGKRSIDSGKYHFLSGSILDPDTETLPYEYAKVGKTSFEISFRISGSGEYAVYVDGSEKQFSLFGTDAEK